MLINRFNAQEDVSAYLDHPVHVQVAQYITSVMEKAFGDLFAGHVIPDHGTFGLCLPDRSGAGPLSVILLLGVNGVGKTTTAAKLCAYYAAYRPVLAAADTFRAGAIDQLKRHGERLGARVVAHKSGGDPAALVFDAIKAAEAGGSHLVIADTAGRMHTKKALVEELKKIDRVIQNAGKGNTDVCALKYLALDATTGRNAVAQAEVFHEAVRLDGVILTKTDSMAKGGVLFSLAGQFALPTAFLCSGEQYDDISVFDAERFVNGFLGGLTTVVSHGPYLIRPRWLAFLLPGNRTAACGTGFPACSPEVRTPIGPSGCRWRRRKIFSTRNYHKRLAFMFDLIAAQNGLRGGRLRIPFFEKREMPMKQK